jgi:ectoine hydroxylase-related dioxygenase (phytanoyl-CoA dioxygenase family)
MSQELEDAVTIEFSEYKDRVKDVLSEYGFVVVKDILSVQEQEEAEKLVYEDLVDSVDHAKIDDERMEKLVDAIKDGDERWPRASIPGIISKGFMSLKGMPQGKYAWYMRTNAKCKEIFSHLHGTDQITVSHDVPFFNPTDVTNDEANLWPHADQNINLKIGSEKSYQGILYVWDSTQPNTSNTVVMPRSWDDDYHTLLEHATPTNLGTTSSHGLYIKDMVDEEEKKELFTKFEKEAVRVQVPAGGLLIFDSRTIHQGYPSGARLAQPISWEPIENRTEGAYLRKLQAMHMGIGTTHWASLGIHHGASFMRSYRPTKYSNNLDSCYIPTKHIKSVPVNNQIRWCRDKTKEELAAEVKAEYRQYI